MKKFLSLLALSLGLALIPAALADTHQVTSLTTGAVVTILNIPGNAQCVTFTNMGAGAVNMVLDGGAAIGFVNTDPTTGSTGICQVVVPAASNGTPGFVTIFIPSFFQGSLVRAIMQSGTTTLNIGVIMRNFAAVPAGTFPVN